MIYLDHAASTSMWDSSLEVLTRSGREEFANPSSSHKLGRSALKKIENARRELLDFLNAEVLYDLFFTSSATESNNTVIRGLGLGEKDNILVSEADHPSLLNPAESLKACGVDVRFIPMMPDGGIGMDPLADSVDAATGLVILSFVNNQSGTINDIRSAARKVKKKNPRTHVHVDGVQGFCKIPFSLAEGEIDSFSVSAHKIGGPKGAAALYLRKGVSVKPLLLGGGQEGGMRSSTRPAPLILSFAEAVKHLSGKYEEHHSKVASLNQKMRDLLAGSIPGILFPFTGEWVSPYILNLIIPGIPSDIIVRHLEEKDIYISTTSACSSGESGENPVFSALGIQKKFHNHVYRISFSGKTEEDEVETFCREIAEIYHDLSGLV